MTEQQVHEVIERRSGYEIRRYPSHWVAQVRLRSDFADAGNKAFRQLVGYIGGANDGGRTIAMTAPVIQSPDSETIDVGLSSDGGREHIVAFVLPASMNASQPPAPRDRSIELRRVPEECAAALRFSGRWTWHSYAAHVERLHAALATDGISTVGPPRFARFDPPWTPWFMRRNEVVVPIACPGAST